jgi:maltoporin
MKLSKLTVACLLATSGFSVTSAANAATTDGLEFHGSFRSGVLLSAEKDFKRVAFPATKEKLGRLGIESDNNLNFNLVKKWNLDDGKSIRVTVGVAGTGDGKSLSSGIDAGGADNQMGFEQTFIELGGITETGTIWAGKRDYGKDNYIFMTDFFYTQMSGTGIGLADYEIGDVKYDFAYMTSDRSTSNLIGRPLNWNEADDFAQKDTNNIMHSVHVGANFGSWELHGQVKSMKDNYSAGLLNGAPAYGNNTLYAETGFDMTAIVHLDSFLGLPGNGFSKVIVQAGQGLGSNSLLGGTINIYNTYAPSNKGDHPSQITMVDEDDQSARLLVWGGYFLDSGINFFPSFQTQYNDNDDGSSNYYMSAMVRSNFPVADNFLIATDLGTQYDYAEDADGNTTYKGNNFKATIAPTWVIGTGQGPAPEIRLLGTYLRDAFGSGDDDFIVGLQADVWW